MKTLKQLLIKESNIDIYDIAGNLVDYIDNCKNDEEGIENFIYAFRDTYDVQDRKYILGLLLKEVNKAYKNECLDD